MKYTNDFCKDAVKYVDNHPELTIKEVAGYLGIPKDTLYGWTRTETRNRLFGEGASSYSEDFSDNLQNILSRNFSPKEPNAIWCTDITYIPTDKGFVYLSSIMDLFSRRIISWELAPTPETKYVVNAVRKAMITSGKRSKVIHTDRGYLSPCAYEKLYYSKHPVKFAQVA